MSASTVPASSRQRLAPHFLLSEFVSGDGAPFPASVVANLRRTASMLEQLRAALGGAPLLVTSGYRTPRWNRLVKGVPRSYHLVGFAADVVTRAHAPIELQEVALQLQARGIIGGVGCYPGFTHVDLGPARTWATEQARLTLGAAGQNPSRR